MSKPKLLDQLRRAIRVRHYSHATERTYVGWVRRFILFHEKRHPREMGKQEVEAFLTHVVPLDKGMLFSAGCALRPTASRLAESSNITLVEYQSLNCTPGRARIAGFSSTTGEPKCHYR